MNTPIYKGKLQSDLDFAGFNALNFPGGGGGSGSGTGLPPGWINVKDAPYNAYGDNVHDDTVAIQTALNDLGARNDGGTLYFPNGDYLCNGNFDPGTNSILKFPYADYTTTQKRITLQGPLNSFGWYGAVIVTTRSDGAGLYPALLAANSPQGVASDELNSGYFSAVYAAIRNMSFVVPYNSTLSGVRLDTAQNALLDTVQIAGSVVNDTAPPNDVVGLWMPNGGNYAQCSADNVTITGFRTGMFFSEHLIARNIFVGQCKVALGALVGYQLAQIHFNSLWCPTTLQQRGSHLPVDLIGRIEDADMRTGSGAFAWQGLANHVDDPSNTIWGTMDYIHVHEPERMRGDITLNGGANLRTFNLYTAANSWNRNSASTVAALPASPVLGQMATVSDGTASLAWGATVTGGGSTKYFVGFNGTNWTVMGK